MEPVIVNETDVPDAVKNINISKSSAFDNVLAIDLKDAFLVLVRELTYTYKFVILYSDCPLEMKNCKNDTYSKAG